MMEKILCVDDNPNILADYKRRLHKKFDIEVAQSGEQGIEVLNNKGPFAVVVSDIRMPGMDGIEFLTKVKECSPDSVQIVLTGYLELQTLVDAVNKGKIFGFLLKPCPIKDFVKTLKEGIAQYQQIKHERELAQKTLYATVRALTKILNIVNPAALRRTSRIIRYVKHIVHELQLPKRWQFELAGTLSQIGCIALPSDIFDKVYNNIPLLHPEQKMFEAYPQIGYELLTDIPELETVANMIKGQRGSFGMYIEVKDNLTKDEIVGLGAQILKVSLDLDRLRVSGMSHEDALAKMGNSQTEDYNWKIMNALSYLAESEVDEKK